MIKYCKLCGAPLEPDMTVCPGCGRFLEQDAPDIAPSPDLSPEAHSEAPDPASDGPAAEDGRPRAGVPWEYDEEQADAPSGAPEQPAYGAQPQDPSSEQIPPVPPYPPYDAPQQPVYGAQPQGLPSEQVPPPYPPYHTPRYAPQPPVYAQPPAYYYPPDPRGYQQPPAYYGLPEQPEAISFGSYLCMSLIGLLPVVGLIYLLVQAVQGPGRPNRRNFARGLLTARLILFAAAVLLLFLGRIGMILQDLRYFYG